MTEPRQWEVSVGRAAGMLFVTALFVLSLLVIVFLCVQVWEAV